MSSSDVSATAKSSRARKSLVAAGLMCATALAGCSADLGRFDMANASFNSDAPRQRSSPVPSEPIRRSNAGGPVDTAPPATPYSYNPAPYQPPAASPAPVRLAGLPDPVSRETEPRRQPEPPRRETAPAPRASGPAAIVPVSAASGTQIEVQQGDTVYALAKRHNVSIAELMSANNLQTPMIRPGQKLVLPAGGRRQSPARRSEKIASAPAGTAAPAPAARASAPAAPASASATTTVATMDPPTGWTGTHTVTPRDSLSVIARRYNAKVADLQAVNGITDPSRLRAGSVLKVPASAASDTASAAPPVPAAAPAAAPVANAPASSAPPGSMGRPTIINARNPDESAPERVAAATPRNPVLTDASPEPAPKSAVSPKPQAASLPGKFRWPAKGRVIANFGPRSDNTHNDGINILVPQGTSVVAAESGTVAYAGSELKGYGNLVLIRHEGNWVSAYAHNESLLVKRGDKVERGQAVAKAGKSGAVDQPQVHFELRQGSKPVDPMPHLEK